MVKEEWREIDEYKGLYWVSNKGRIKNSKGLVRKPHLNSSGYVQVALFKEKKFRNVLVHRFVAKAFLKNPGGQLEVNHKDGNKLNNCVDNLEWVTKRQNHLHRVYALKKSSYMPPKRVKCIETGRIFPSVSMATIEMGLKNPICISNAAHGVRHKAANYHWEFIK